MKKSVDPLAVDLAPFSLPEGRFDRALTSTEAALAEMLGGLLHVESVPVDSNFFEDLGADSMVMAQFCARVRKHPELPSVSMKDIYQHPTIAGLATSLGPAGPTSAPPPPAPVDRVLAEILAEILHVASVPVDSSFFEDLGADSMVMAQFCARVRKRSDLPSVSMKDIYQHPTITGLATALEPGLALAPGAAPAKAEAGPATDHAAPVPEPSGSPPTAVGTRSTSRSYVLCGALQLLIFLGYVWLGAWLFSWGYTFMSGGTGTLGIYLRSVMFSGVALVAMCSLPVVAKWALIGRWSERDIPVWSLTYLRFWVVKTLVRSNPLVLVMVGSPLYSLYLRALGARVGRGVVILTRTVPVCTDLLTIGDHTVIRKEALISGYRAEAGVIRTGPVTLGRDVFVGEKTVLDIDTRMGTGAQLGHSSSLHPGQAVPEGERWHGTPAQHADVDYATVGAARLSTLRRIYYPTQQVLALLLLWLPLGFGGIVWLLAAVPSLGQIMDSRTLAVASWSFYRDALLVSAVIFFGGVLVGLVIIGTLPRLLALAVKPEKVYRLYGFPYSVHRLSARLSNSKFFTYLFGDSSYIVGYLRYLGYRMHRPIQQTGSNFGTMVAHENPFAVTIGSGTMVADGLSIINADFSSTSFRISPTTIGAHSFLGNHIAFPAQSRTGSNVLLATKVMVPIDGPVRENVGLLGSPSFEIPRTVQRDSSRGLRSRGELRRRLRSKNRYNLRSMALALLVRWFHFFGMTVLTLAAADVYRQLGAVAVAADVLAGTVFTMGYFVFVERAVARFRRLTPQYCSIYDPYFWWHERFWKLVIPAFDRMLVGTPYKNVISRLLGVRIGKRVFDDGCNQPERTLVAIGDFCTLNAGSIIQTHSQEDGVFKSDRSTVGADCTIGVGALVHYGVTMGDGSVLAADSFLMKGEDVPAGAHWGGNPAREMPELAGRLQVTRADHGRGEGASDDSGSADSGSADSGSGDGGSGDSGSADGGSGDSGTEASARPRARARRLVETTQGGKR